MDLMKATHLGLGATKGQHLLNKADAWLVETAQVDPCRGRQSPGKGTLEAEKIKQAKPKHGCGHLCPLVLETKAEDRLMTVEYTQDNNGQKVSGRNISYEGWAKPEEGLTPTGD